MVPHASNPGARSIPIFGTIFYYHQVKYLENRALMTWRRNEQKYLKVSRQEVVRDVSVWLDPRAYSSVAGGI
jgi:hypothetical protein